MERLTEHTQKGASIILDNPQTEEEARKQLMEKFKIVVNCLAAYEDTGLTPAEIEQMKADREWVSVAERLPKKEDGDERGEVLCGDLYEDSSIRFMTKYTCNWNEVKDAAKFGEATHWMPLATTPDKGKL
jgi:hypothetical protein